MVIYGVCISEIKKYNEEKAEKFLESLRETKASDIVEEYFVNKEENGYNLNEFFYNFEGEGGYYGTAACLKEIIAALEGINISCDDPSGIHYLGLSIDAPWKYNEKTRNMSEEDYRKILAKYISYFTDEVLEIKWWSVNDDCDW